LRQSSSGGADSCYGVSIQFRSQPGCVVHILNLEKSHRSIFARGCVPIIVALGQYKCTSKANAMLLCEHGLTRSDDSAGTSTSSFYADDRRRWGPGHATSGSHRASQITLAPLE